MPSRLTFGVELEFALALLEEGKADPEPELRRPVHFLPSRLKTDSYFPSFELKNTVYGLVATKLIAAGLPARTMGEGSSEGSGRSNRSNRSGRGREKVQSHSQPAIQESSGLQETAGDSNDSSSEPDRTSQRSTTSSGKSDEEFGSKWMVTEDPTVRPTRRDDYWWFSMEVQSPPYILCEDALQAVRLACLHVHLAEGSDGYAFLTVKKLIAFLWTFEPQIEQLHPNRRARLRRGEDRSWYESLRRGSTLVDGQFTDSSVQITVIQGLKYIYAAPNIDALNDMMKAELWKSAYYLGAIGIGDPGDDTIKKTIEFRQHEGTLSGDHIVGWIKTIATLVEWITDVESIALLGLVEAAADLEDRYWPEQERPKYDITDLFRDIGLVELANYWDRTIPMAIRKPPTLYYKRYRDPPRQAPEALGNRNVQSNSDSDD